LPQLLTEFHGAVLDAESANQLSFFNL
jgi:hypothetical protein